MSPTALGESMSMASAVVAMPSMKGRQVVTKTMAEVGVRSE